MAKVLITGGNGLIGSRLKELLLAAGHIVNVIGRGKHDGKTGVFSWNIPAGEMDIKALDQVDTIVHLAGTGVADMRWTAARKKEIYDSRINSTRVLFDALARSKHQVKTIIAASAVGYYGDCGSEVVTEKHPKGDSFLAKVTSDWEAEVARMDTLSIRHVCCRIGIVLSRHGGALPALERTVPLGVAGYFANPDLYYSWIHIDDVCEIMMHAMKSDQMHGSYNTTAPQPVLIKELMQAIVGAKRSKALLVPIPPLAIRLALGDMSEAVLQSQRCSDKKIIDAGFRFTFPDLKGALENIYQ